MYKRIRIVSFLVVAISFTLLAFYFATSFQNKVEVTKVQELNKFVREKQIESKEITTDDTVAEDANYTFVDNPAKEMINEIKDYVGWVTIEDTAIDYPIVRANDNEFYLNHNFKGDPYIGGAIFMDRRNLGNNLDAHTIIYGHYMKNGSMFTQLNNYLDEDFLKAHPTIKVDYLFQTVEYKVVAAYYVSADTFELPYAIEDLTDKFSLQGVDQLLTLSTCNYILENGRMIVHAVPIDKSE